MEWISRMQSLILNKNILFLSALALAGCSVASLKPGAEIVKISHGQPKGCNYLGEVSGHQRYRYVGDPDAQIGRSY